MRISDWSSDVCSSDLVNLAAVFEVVSDYTQTIATPAQARHVIDRALRIAAAERTVTCIIVPNDVQMMDAVPSPPRAHGNNYSSVGYAPSHPVPSAEALQHAADILNSGEKVAVLSGAGALQIGRAHVRTPVTNAPLVCRLLL